MTVHTALTVTTRFPLVDHKRPPAKPLDGRVARLVGLAENAVRDQDSDTASMVFNGAALVASDCGDAELARSWCHRHASLYLRRAPLDGHAARFALEPIVNLARLRIRAGDGDAAHSLLTDLFQAIHGRTATVIDGIELRPEHLPADPDQRDHILEWLRDVLLADGTRAYTSAGKWADALTHVRRYSGIGSTLREGRQVAIIALAMRGNNATAAALLNEATFEHPWEQVVHDLLQTWHAQTTGVCRPATHEELLDRALEVPTGPGLSVFRTRLCLAAIDLIPDVPQAVARNAISVLVPDVLRSEDANAARDLHHHYAAGPEHHERLTRLIAASGLAVGQVPEKARESLTSALELAEKAIGATSAGTNPPP
ncbi:MAG: hypothetical protein QOH97_5526 [Actinoplanes sp.]|jgi:hypothetical protein|nr:hypothetical protein [Actinoplanes sp.]